MTLIITMYYTFTCVHYTCINSWAPTSLMTFICTASLMRLLLILCVHPQYGDTPLNLAVVNGKLPIIELLVQQGANMRHCNNVSIVNCIHVSITFLLVLNVSCSIVKCAIVCSLLQFLTFVSVDILNYPSFCSKICHQLQELKAFSHLILFECELNLHLPDAHQM